jgi:hypothetical protein
VTTTPASEALREVAVVIPALNEAAALPRVLAALPAVCRVVVVDNGSTDGTGDVAGAAGAEVVVEPRRGYGSACLAGLAALADRPPRVVVFLDADAADDPALLPRLAGPILADEADFVLGSRTLGSREPGALPLHARLGNRLATCLLRMLHRGHATDLGPFRAIGYSALNRLAMRDPTYGWTIEMQIKAARQRLRTLEIPVPYRRRVGRSKISGTVTGSLRAGVGILSAFWRYRRPDPNERLARAATVR